MPPPDDDDIVATTHRALMALEADMMRELDGPNPRREQLREMARDMRNREAGLIESVGKEKAALAAGPVQRSWRRVVRILGTSAWDEPEDGNKPRPPGLGPTV